MNILLTLILLTNLALIGIVLIIALKVRSTYENLREELRTFISAPDEKTPSPLAELTTAVTNMAVSILMDKVKATIQGIQSGAVRANNASEVELAETVIGQANPLLGLIAQLLPKAIKHKIAKREGLIDAVVSKFGNKPAIVTEAGNNGHSQVKFKL